MSAPTRTGDRPGGPGQPARPSADASHQDRVLAGLADWQRGVRAQFPILAGTDEAYLDSAATAQKPQVVLDAVQHYLTTGNANAGRGTYRWANRTTDLVSHCRARVADLIGAGEPDAVHLVGGTTEALRRVALDWLVDILADGDEIVVPAADHLANVLPWREARDLAARRGVTVRLVEMPYEPSGDYDLAALAPLVGERTRLVALTHVHHVYGVDMNVHRVRRLVGDDVVLCLDAAQSVGHLPVSAPDLDVDFLAFSGHKAMALSGIGVLWAANRRGPRYAHRGWEGSPHTAGAASLAAAVDWFDATGLDRIEAWTVALGARLTDGLARLPGFQVLGCQDSLTLDSTVQRRHGLVTFRHPAISAADLGFVLAEHGLMVRANAHCQGPAGERESSVRVSLHVYNTVEEVDRLLDVLARLDASSHH
ncbi:cysteine desulfurase / selenocysteine lyase [Micromonospora nigra]|uniref:Cysteine desulfurase / selenocysteine lyase n=1 Tax=Micromonospora nigra TaxID=145857 RepID=A0A1C6R8X8_9ACTN|nr:aminotransferase class V-fold PLP-dependent enzyme [Micromonospora nigra]SCL13553.1 cysteine desulfurase / selenocysteine lyase [Micromonospora nigra]